MSSVSDKKCKQQKVPRKVHKSKNFKGKEKLYTSQTNSAGRPKQELEKVTFIYNVLQLCLNTKDEKKHA